jgi:endo-1,4-beta-mannosidase
MYWWSDFDAGEVQDEFALVHELGLNVVRLFLLWDDFQPTPDTVSPECLKALTKVCDIAAEQKLGLDVTFFTGHMSGPNWSPEWLLAGERPAWVRQLVSGGRIVESGYRDPYTDPVAISAEKLQLRTVVGALRDHPAIWMWNLGNEPDLFAQPATWEIGRAWVRDMVGVIREIDSQHPVTCGLHVASLIADNGLRIDKVYGETDVAVMHSYAMYSKLARWPLDPDYVPFTCALTTALCGKPVLMEEFGGPTAAPGKPSFDWEWTAYGKPHTQFMASEDEFAAYMAATLPRLVEVGATGAFLWCFADYIEELWDKPPCSESRHERFFGLVRPDGSLKPHAQVVKEFAATRPMVQPVPAWAKIEIDADAFYRAPTDHLPRLYEGYLSRQESQSIRQ